jgi:hypothetical protein
MHVSMKQDGVSNDSDRVPSHDMWVNSFLCTHKKTDRDPDLEVSGAGSQVRGVSETHRSGQGSGQGFQNGLVRGPVRGSR